MRFHKAFTILLLLLAVSFPGHAESKKQKLWKISVAVLGAVTIADVQSSYGRPEINPLLRSPNGSFSSRGISVKSLIVGGSLTAQYFMLKKNPEASGWAAGANFAAAAATGAVVARNHMLK